MEKHCGNQTTLLVSINCRWHLALWKKRKDLFLEYFFNSCLREFNQIVLKYSQVKKYCWIIIFTNGYQFLWNIFRALSVFPSGFIQIYPLNNHRLEIQNHRLKMSFFLFYRRMLTNWSQSFAASRSSSNSPSSFVVQKIFYNG